MPPTKGTTGVPVYDEQGAPFAPSVSEAAALLRCSHAALIKRHLTHHADGYRLTSRPLPQNVGRVGGPFRHKEHPDGP